MYHPLVQRLLDELGYPEITLENHDRFVAAPGVNLLCFVGDPATNRESTDVAVVLPELVAAFAGRLRSGVVASYECGGAELQRHYGFAEWPALVLVRGGGYLGAITRIRNWDDYLRSVAELLAASPRRAPGFEIPVVSEPAG
jgi:hydrogenase-1 operon protein HyaE